jgi:hypothetical protein
VEITQKLLKEMFFYKEGKLFNKTKRAKKTIIGSEAGALQSTGYRVIRINRKLYKAHRLIYIFHHGEIPDGLYIDHIDRQRLNNSIENLRLVTRQENGFNRSVKGYCFNKARNKFHAQINLNGKKIYLGLFETAKEARAAYLKAKKELHKIEEKIKGE